MNVADMLTGAWGMDFVSSSPFSLLPPLFSKFSEILKKGGGGSREKGEEETKSMPHAPVDMLTLNAFFIISLF